MLRPAHPMPPNANEALGALELVNYQCSESDALQWAR